MDLTYVKNKTLNILLNIFLLLNIWNTLRQFSDDWKFEYFLCGD